MIEKSVILHCDPERAFALFTASISDWWPKTHRLSKDPESVLTMESTGRFWERATDGREVELGRVLLWEPPARIVMDFYLGTNPNQPTEVEILFSPSGTSTLVTVHHRSKPGSEDLWMLRAPAFDRNWSVVLGEFAAVVNE
ncbi:MAG: SRPBCC domain-containing protein [Bryobacteraceae bacterium]